MNQTDGPRGDVPANQAGNEWAKNDAVRAALKGYGDDGTLPRHVIHFAYPVASGARGKAEAAGIVTQAGPGFAFTQTEDSAGLVFEHHREVASAGFDALTQTLADGMSAIGWTYDGWECAVETGEERPA